MLVPVPAFMFIADLSKDEETTVFAHVPCVIRETFISVLEISVYSIWFILSYEN
jgi:hypothetical protein